MSGWLRKMLGRIQLLQSQLRSFFQLADGPAFFFLIIRFHIHGHKTVKGKAGCRRGEYLAACTDPHRCRLIYRWLHAAGGKALPDQLIQAEQISLERLLHDHRGEADVRRPDRLMGILYLCP